MIYNDSSQSCDPPQIYHHIQWIRLRENLQETIDFPMKIMGFSGEHFPVHQSKTHLQFLQFDHYIYNFKPINF